MTHNQKFEIRSDVPLPGNAKYPFNEMEIGGSFVVPMNGSVSAGSVRSAASYASKTLNRKFITRFDGAGICVWRTE